MSRATRIEFDGACYHVMSRGVARMRTFLDDDDRRAFLEILGQLVGRSALEVHAFCLMPNHYHMLVQTPRAELSRWMRHVNGDYVRRFNVRHRRVGHLWQGRYKAILVEEGSYLRECSRYIHLNPNRAKITRPAERYRWSSYRSYVGGRSAVPWVQTRLVLAGFDGDQRKYRAYVEAGKGEKQISPFTRAVAGLALGGETFLARVRKLVQDQAASEDEPALAQLRRSALADPKEVERAVEQVFGNQVGAARQQRLLLYAQRQHSRLRSAEIARRYGRTRAAVTMAAKVVGAEAEKDQALAVGLVSLSKILGENVNS
jgi:REP element-mobilizing transposase RayT